MKTVFIYALCEPGTRNIRYLGKAKNPEQRRAQHCRPSQKRKNHLGYWLSGLSELPTLLVLKEVLENEWQEWEQRYIRCARALGFKLVNGTDGGEGVNGRNYTTTEETKKKQSVSQSGEKNGMFGRKHSKETREKIRIARLRRPHPLLGKTLPPEWCANISAARVGKKHFPEALVKMSAAQSGEKNGMFGVHRFGDKNPMFGKNLSKESILKRQASRSSNRLLKICQPLE